jgi:hypothetical protein
MLPGDCKPLPYTKTYALSLLSKLQSQQLHQTCKSVIRTFYPFKLVKWILLNHVSCRTLGLYVCDLYHANTNPMAREKSRPLDSRCQLLMMTFSKPRAPKSLSFLCWLHPALPWYRMENVPDLLSSRPFLILQASSYLSIALVHVALDHQNWKVIKN